MSQWPYPYCPHQAFNKNLKLRLASIPYSFVPDPTIDAFTNVNIKCANLDKHNIPSLAYEDFFTGKSQNNTNFVMGYYLENKDVDAIKFDNRVVAEKQEELQKRSAYVLASEATEQYQKFEQNRRNALDNARRRAVSTLRTHYIQKQDEQKQANHENGQWLKKLYRKLEEIAKHIVEGQGQSQADKQKMFLLSKGSLNANYLKNIKVRNPKVAFDILEELRILMMKKKLRFQDQRQEQEKNKSVTVSMTTEASQNTSQGSMLSQATSINESNIDGEQELIAKFSDFEKLSKKWGTSDVAQVKYLLRLMLTRKYVSQAEVNAIKKKKEAERINTQLEKLNPELAKKIQKDKEAKKENQKKSITKRAQSATKFPKKGAKEQAKPVQVKGLRSTGLSKNEELVKEKLISGGQFDAIGQKFARNRNFSLLFTKRQEQGKMQFEMKNEKGSIKTTPLSKIMNRDTTLDLCTSC